VTPLLGFFPTIFANEGQVLWHVVAYMRQKILADLVGVSAVGPFASRVNGNLRSLLV
jgi:hypothetical protein